MPTYLLRNTILDKVLSLFRAFEQQNFVTKKYCCLRRANLHCDELSTYSIVACVGLQVVLPSYQLGDLVWAKKLQLALVARLVCGNEIMEDFVCNDHTSSSGRFIYIP